MAEIRKRKLSEQSTEELDYRAEIEIDSTAPLHKIVKNFLSRERFSKVYRLYLMLLVQRRKVVRLSKHLHYIVPGHPLKAFPENWDGQVKPGYFEPFQYKSTMPKVISQMRNIGKSDPVTDYMQIKTDWRHEIGRHKKNLAYLLKRNKVQKYNDDVALCPKFLIDFATRLEHDPDPNFFSTYNWYYAGSGNMHLVCIAWVDYLLHSDGTTVYLTRLHKEEMRMDPENEASYDCKENILETICSSQNIVALRTMKIVIILKIIEIDNHLYFDKIKSFESETPFTSVAFDGHHKNILYATRLDAGLSIVNLDRMRARSVRLKRTAGSIVNNWNAVIAGEHGSFVHVERRAVTFYDKRTNGAINAVRDLDKIVEEAYCNDVSAALLRAGGPSLYLATDHHLLLLDARCAAASRPRPGLRWTHGLTCPPTYMAAAGADGSRDLVALASQWCQDVCVVSSRADSVDRAYDIPGVSLPYHAPGPMDTLEAARARRLCAGPGSVPDSRLVAATTGLALAELALLTHSSLGDVMLRTLYTDYMESLVEDDAAEALAKWNEANMPPPRLFEVSSVSDVAKVWRKLRRVPGEHRFGPRARAAYREEDVCAAFAREELLPELLDAWEAPGAAAGDSSLMLRYDDSDSEVDDEEEGEEAEGE